MPFVYCATNQISKKQYIGVSSTTVRKRWGKHRQSARSTHPKRSTCHALHSAIRKYGIDSFIVETVYEAVDWREACAVEKAIIAERGTYAPGGYNLTSGGDGAPGLRVSEYAKQMASKNSKGRKHTPEALALLTEANRRNSADPEVREKIAAALTGIKRSDETKRRNSEAAKARWKVPGYKEQIVKSTKGRPFAPEHLANVKAGHKSPERSAKLSAAFKGKPKSPAHVAKLRGKKRTPEQCARISAGTRAANARKAARLSAGQGSLL